MPLMISIHLLPEIVRILRDECLSRRVLVRINGAPNHCRHRCADERSDDEDPQVGQRRSALEECRADGARGIDGRARVADADEVNEHQRESDG